MFDLIKIISAYLLTPVYQFPAQFWNVIITRSRILVPGQLQECPCSDKERHNSDIIGNPISPPKRAARVGEYTCYIDHKHELYSITWCGSMQYPNTTQFPNDMAYAWEKVKMTPEMSIIWLNSTLINYGADAILRCSHTGRYPVVKLTNPDEQSRARIQREFQILREMATQTLPTPRFDSQTLHDSLGIFGYRLELLLPLTASELKMRLQEVREAVQHLHQAGFCHGDLNPSNIMKNTQGAITIIDFGFAGRIGSVIPKCVPTWVYPGPDFTVDTDKQALDQLAE